MIVEWFLGAAVTFLEWVVGTFPVLPVPEWIDPGIGNAVGVLGPYMAGTSVWFPVPLMLGVAVALVAATLVGFTIKLARIILSLFTAGGGSAA